MHVWQLFAYLIISFLLFAFCFLIQNAWSGGYIAGTRIGKMAATSAPATLKKQVTWHPNSRNFMGFYRHQDPDLHFWPVSCTNLSLYLIENFENENYTYLEWKWLRNAQIILFEMRKQNLRNIKEVLWQENGTCCSMW